jgi:hypothetical protein
MLYAAGLRQQKRRHEDHYGSLNYDKTEKAENPLKSRQQFKT